MTKTNGFKCAAHWMLEANTSGYCRHWLKNRCILLKIECPYDGRHENKYPPKIDKALANSRRRGGLIVHGLPTE